MSKTSSTAALDDALEAAWEGAAQDAPRKGDRVIARDSENPDYSVFNACTDYGWPHSDIRILERAEQSEPEPEWLDALVIKGVWYGRRHILARDAEGDFFILGTRDPGAEYLLREDATAQLSDVEILVEE